MSVLTVDAAVVATPSYIVRAPEKGVVVRSQITTDARVLSGQVIARQDGTKIKAPVAGFFVEWLVPNRVEVNAGIPIAVLRSGGFGLSATVPPENAFRLYSGPTSARGQVLNGPGPFACPLLDAPSSGRDEQDGGPRSSILCVVPDDQVVFDGLKALVAVETAERTGVLLAPAGAVTAKSGEGLAWKVVEGRPVQVPVTVGITDGVNVEIVSGLAEGDQLLPYGPAVRMETQ